MIRGPTLGKCSMQDMDYSTQTYFTTTSCTDGSLIIATNDSAVRGLALLKTYGSDTYLLSSLTAGRRAGATFT